MDELWKQIIAAVGSQRPVAYCRLVETRGSTPQKAGATMLVFADGTQAGTLGGGCAEAEIRRRGLALLESGSAEIVTLTLDDDYGWDDGLICGGRMRVLIDPVRPGDSLDYFQQLLELSTRGGIEAIVIEPKCEQQSEPAIPCPLAMLFDDAEQLVATRNGNVSELALRFAKDNLRPLTDRPRPYARQGIAYLPLLPRCRLLIVGGGHVGQKLAELAAELDFDVWVLDDRAEYVSPERFPHAKQRLSGPVGPSLKQLDITPSDYCVIVTRGHNHDEEALFHLIDRGAGYLGMIGSQRKIKLIFDDLAAEGVSPESLQNVYAPLGIDIGSQTVAEIAISIAAELVAHRNRGVVPGRMENTWSTGQRH